MNYKGCWPVTVTDSSTDEQISCWCYFWYYSGRNASCWTPYEPPEVDLLSVVSNITHQDLLDTLTPVEIKAIQGEILEELLNGHI